MGKPPMNVIISLGAVTALFLFALIGVEALGWGYLFGNILPYIAFAVFVVGLISRVIRWARSPVPFRIPTTCGQQKSLSWIKPAYFESPYTTLGVIGRMAAEVLLFRSLFRNTQMELHTDIEGGPKVAYGPVKWLWAAGLAFHWTFLVILIRHTRFFLQDVSVPIELLQELDGFLQVGVPVIYTSTGIFLAAVTYLFVRRVVVAQVRYISLVNDYFPLFLLLGIGLTGATLRHLVKTDLAAVKELAMGLVSFAPVGGETLGQIHWLFFTHLFLVCTLFAYFPFSKLTHMAGVFLSPTRNLANNNRMIRHVNPWDYPVKTHSYQAYEDEFRERMVEVGIPVDKTLEEAAKDAPKGA